MQVTRITRNPIATNSYFCKTMKFISCSVALAALALAGCFAFKPVEVHITPTAYQTGNIKSELATPVVDEVVRLKPSKVLIIHCKTTPFAKVFQFEIELQARHRMELSWAVADDGCPSA
ncbi:hypothetical protein VLK31_35950 [Variovorax sp. H27-G14]|uniref:hypothetical protein n=1 Tax=Variovorax sp. H27-G14 TaxID=3111914 RepID=UPI0038FC1A80